MSRWWENSTMRIGASILRCGPIPRHVAFIMDGNRRWAKNYGKQSIHGHKAGYLALARTLQWCLELGVRVVSVFAFSIDNFRRPETEVDGLLRLAEEKFRQLLDETDIIEKHGVRVKVLGELSLLPPGLQRVMAQAMRKSAKNTAAVLNVCFSYTSREEITHAVRELAYGVREGELQPNDISVDLLEQCLHTGGGLPVDMIIRTSGEIRLSDFLLWQGSFACLVFVKSLWPSFGVIDLLGAVITYQRSYPVLKSLREEYEQHVRSRNDGSSSDCERVEQFVLHLRERVDRSLSALDVDK